MSWRSYQRAAECGPVRLFFQVLPALLVVAAAAGTAIYLAGWFGEGAAVMREEFGPRELLRKYEWFKDAAAQCDAKLASLRAYDARQRAIIESYEGAKRSEWSRADTEQFNLWESEKAGIKASYNQLAAEYNAQMAKFNWRFCEAGRLPEGATEPLPREFKPYVEE